MTQDTGLPPQTHSETNGATAMPDALQQVGDTIAEIMAATFGADAERNTALRRQPGAGADRQAEGSTEVDNVWSPRGA